MKPAIMYFLSRTNIVQIENARTRLEAPMNDIDTKAIMENKQDQSKGWVGSLEVNLQEMKIQFAALREGIDGRFAKLEEICNVDPLKDKDNKNKDRLVCHDLEIISHS